MLLGRRKKSDLKIDLNVYLEKGAYNGTAQGLKDEIDNLKSRAVGENVASEVDLSNYLEKGGYEGTAQDLKNELDNLSIKIEENTLTEVDLVELKKIATGNRFTIKYSDGTMTSAKYDELLNAVRDKQVEEISVNTDGLENYSFKFKMYDVSLFRSVRLDDVENGIRKTDFDNSGFYFDVFDYETKSLVVRNKISLSSFYYSSIFSNSLSLKYPLDREKKYFVRLTKYGVYTEYQLFVLGRLLLKDDNLVYKSDFYGRESWVRNSLFEFGEEQTEVLLIKELEVENRYNYEKRAIEVFDFDLEDGLKIFFCKGVKQITLTNLYVDNNQYKRVDDLLIDGYDSLTKLLKGGSDFSGEYLGKKYWLSDIVDFTISLNTRNEVTGYYKIQLINTENQEVVFEKDNREDNTDTITLENVQLPKLLTIKLWTNESLLEGEEGAVLGD